MRSTPALTVGLFAGLLFFAHGMINNSQGWALVWPLLGGAVSVWIASRRGSLKGFGSALGTGFGAGAVAGAVFFVTTATLAALGAISTGSLTNDLLRLGLAAIAGVALASLAGACTYVFARATSQES